MASLDKKDVHVSVRIPSDTKAVIDAYCVEEDMTTSTFIRKLVRDWVKVRLSQTQQQP